jgi:MOSC domain-containing protein YiiM
LVSTGIFKQPVVGRVAVRRLNLDGDRQADLSVHGGPDKAVYTYPAEHYPYWHMVLPGTDVPWAAFGENLTTTGLTEETVNIGDRFRVGSAELVATQPRTPCYKLGLRFGRADMVRLFYRSGRSGIYFAVLEEGEVAAGDAITLIQRAEGSLSVADINSLYARGDDDADAEMLRRATEIEALPEGWRAYFRQRRIRAMRRTAAPRRARTSIAKPSSPRPSPPPTQGPSWRRPVSGADCDARNDQHD